MVALYVALLLTPFAVAAAIQSSVAATAFVGRHYRACSAVGWSAIALSIPAVAELDGARRTAALAFLCPLMALGFWRRPDGGDGGGGGGGDDPEPALPTPPEIDWERFMRELDDYSASPR